MTDDGPFSWEGEHFQYRVVNPWARVLQKPHPRIWVPGVFSAETIRWAAEHRYPYISLNTPLHLTGELWQIYDQAARAVGYEAGPENRGYLLRVHVQEDGDKARENAREFMWMQGEFTGIGHPYWVSPSGYGSSARRLDYAKMANAEVRGSRAASFEKQLAAREIVAGTPDEVIAELRVVLETCRPSILMLWGNDGGVTHRRLPAVHRAHGHRGAARAAGHGRRSGPARPLRAGLPHQPGPHPARRTEPG